MSVSGSYPSSSQHFLSLTHFHLYSRRHSGEASQLVHARITTLKHPNAMGKDKFWRSDDRISASWVGASGHWEKADVSELPFFGRSTFRKSNPPPPKSSMNHLPRSNSRSGCESHMEAPKKSYSKDELMHVHHQLLSNRKLMVPRGCEIPASLQRQGLVLGSREFSQDKWVCSEPSGKVWGPVSRLEIMAGRESGEFNRDLRVVPLSWIQESCVSVETMNRMWGNLSPVLKQSISRVSM